MREVFCYQVCFPPNREADAHGDTVSKWESWGADPGRLCFHHHASGLFWQGQEGIPETEVRADAVLDQGDSKLGAPATTHPIVQV